MYTKIAKYISLALILVSVVGFVAAAATGFTDAGVNVILYISYAMVALGIIAILGIGIAVDAKVDPKGLVRLGIIVVAAIALIGIAYLIAPGTAPLDYHGEMPTQGELILTDTVLNLTYFSVFAAIAAIIFGIVYGKVKGNK
ncbi:MAG: hypothetical protein MJY62_02985 [Bacteroidales bacterium]|nr:hypothetical protein [Bacteroidales bacterium]